MRVQYFDAAVPKEEEAKPEAGAGADLGALIAEEVQALKREDSRLFQYVKTNVNGLLYLDMRRDVGAHFICIVMQAITYLLRDSYQHAVLLC